MTARLEILYPPEAAEDWDNVGLLVGDEDWDVSKVYLALDARADTVRAAVEAGADMLITHHPMIFSGLKRINSRDFVGRKVLTLVEHRIACYAMHTNYDVLGMGKMSADLLGLQNREVLSPTREINGVMQGLGRVGDLPRPMTLRDCAALVTDGFGIPEVRLYGNPDRVVERAAVCTGSGKSLIPDVLKKGAQVYVTGDIDHHTAIDALDQGLAILDAGHYGTEYIFSEAMKKVLRREFPDLEITCAGTAFPWERL